MTQPKPQTEPDDDLPMLTQEQIAALWAENFGEY
jgi:hypothetical protein